MIASSTRTGGKQLAVELASSSYDFVDLGAFAGMQIQLDASGPHGTSLYIDLRYGKDGSLPEVCP